MLVTTALFWFAAEQPSGQAPTRLALTLEDYAALPITGEIDGANTRGQLARVYDPPAQGIRGNSHMIMQDRNHLQLADVILRWIDERVSR